MGRVRKNYILFKNDGREPVLAGSFSSKKRARVAMQEELAKEAQKQYNANCNSPIIEYTPNSGKLIITETLRIVYEIITLTEDELEDV